MREDKLGGENAWMNLFLSFGTRKGMVQRGVG
jgi:hypothetical protein